MRGRCSNAPRPVPNMQGPSICIASRRASRTLVVSVSRSSEVDSLELASTSNDGSYDHDRSQHERRDGQSAPIRPPQPGASRDEEDECSSQSEHRRYRPRCDPDLGRREKESGGRQQGTRPARLGGTRRGQGQTEGNVQIGREVVGIEERRHVLLVRVRLRGRGPDAVEPVCPECRVQQRGRREDHAGRDDQVAQERHTLASPRQAQRRRERQKVRDPLEHLDSRGRGVQREGRPARACFVQRREGARPDVCVAGRHLGQPGDGHRHALQRGVSGQTTPVMSSSVAAERGRKCLASAWLHVSAVATVRTPVTTHRVTVWTAWPPARPWRSRRQQLPTHEDARHRPRSLRQPCHAGHDTSLLVALAPWNIQCPTAANGAMKITGPTRWCARLPAGRAGTRHRL